ncbi:MAG: hypothetical protein LBC82_01355 [Oscillospiraceae bacterium]|jgi:hypothetical protein|nr:hypothetical protein [Oscillospiraceae bacterium]
MKNKLDDLNNHLFAQLERLSDEDITGEKLLEEVTRAKSITGVSKTIIENAQLVLNASKYVDEHESRNINISRMIDTHGD